MKVGNPSVARGRRASGASPKYLVGRPAREAKYAAPARSFQLRAAQRAEKRRLPTLSNTVDMMFPPEELSAETTKESVLNDKVPEVECT